jgi:murein DD-endopeptidase MepM/ murein hydrolase activator NlpD
VRAVTPMIYRHSPSRRRTGRWLLGFVVSLALMAAGVILICYQDSNSQSSSASLANGQASSLNSVDPDPADSCPATDLKVCAVDQEIQGKPVEISDISSDGDSLLALLALNVCDDNLAGKIADNMAETIRRSLSKRFLPTDELKSGARYVISLGENREFLKASLELDPSNVFHCVKDGDAIKSWKEDTVLEYKPEVLCFKIRKDIVQSVLDAHEGKELALKLVHLFRWGIDFQSDSAKGDELRVVFERRYADDKPTGYGRILMAVYDGKKTGRKSACLFNENYYDENGVELKRDYLRTPLNTLRITSGFGWRIHPVLNERKFHYGVDYGAPTGTPVFAISDGVVSFQGCDSKGIEKGYGLYVCVRHDNGYESRYSHLSRILVKSGQKVKQRQVIGLVGTTGYHTGPHLFFQILENDKALDPTKIKMVKYPKSVPSALKTRFDLVLGYHEQFIDQSSGDAPHQIELRKFKSAANPVNRRPL